jgi:hypothetical protein
MCAKTTSIYSASMIPAARPSLESYSEQMLPPGTVKSQQALNVEATPLYLYMLSIATGCHEFHKILCLCAHTKYFQLNVLPHWPSANVAMTSP